MVHMFSFMDDPFDWCILDFDMMVDSYVERVEHDPHFDKLGLWYLDNPRIESYLIFGLHLVSFIDGKYLFDQN